MKKLLALISALIMLAAALPALAEDAPDMAALCPAAPITLAEYTALFTQMMEACVDPEYSQYATWKVATLPDGSIVATDGVTIGGVAIVSVTVEGAYVKRIRVAWPYDGTNAQEAFNFYSSWCVIAAVPVRMRDGLTFDDALAAVESDFTAVMHKTSARDVVPVAGMEAQMGRTTGEGAAVTMTYTFHQEPAKLPQPAGGDLTVTSATAYMAAFEADFLALMGEPLIWTNPEEWLGATLIAGDSLMDIPALMIVDDQLAMLMVSMPMYEDNPGLNHDTMRAFAQLALVPLLKAGGMSPEEAEAAWAQWVTEAHFPALLVSAQSGTPCTTTFHGFRVMISMEDDRFSLSLASPLVRELDIPEGDVTE